MKRLFSTAAFTLNEKRFLYMAGTETNATPEETEAPKNKNEEAEGENKVENQNDVENKMEEKIQEANQDIAEDEKAADIDDGTEEGEEQEEVIDPELQNMFDKMVERGVSPKVIEAVKKIIEKDPQSEAALHSLSEKAEANPGWTEHAAAYINDPASFDASDPAKKVAKDFVDSLTPKEREIFEVILETSKDTTAKPAETKDANGNLLLPPENLASIQNGVNQYLAGLKKSGVDVTTLRGKARELIAGKLMMDFGVNVTDAADKSFAITLPKTAKEAGWNKIMGTISYIMAFFAEEKEADTSTKEKNEKEKEKNAAKTRVTEELKQPGKTVDVLITEKTQKQATLKNEIGGEETGGLKKDLRTKSVEMDKLSTDMNKLGKDDPKRAEAQTKIDALKKDIEKLKTDIQTKEKELKNIDEDLKVLAEMKNGGKKEPEKTDIEKKYAFIQGVNDWQASELPDENSVKYLKTETGKIIRKFQMNMHIVKEDGSLKDIAAESGFPEGNDAVILRRTLEQGGLKNWVDAPQGYQYTVHDDGNLVLRYRQTTKDATGKITAQTYGRYASGKGWGPDTL